MKNKHKPFGYCNTVLEAALKGISVAVGITMFVVLVAVLWT